MQNQDRNQSDSQTVFALSISPHPEDYRSLCRVLDGPHYRLYSADCLASARPLFAIRDISVVLCESDLSPGTWRDVLDDLARLPDAPCLIVTSRLADERLWAEALNLGAWDVLPTPFHPAELVRSVDVAWQHWRYRDRAGKKLMKTKACGAAC